MNPVLRRELEAFLQGFRWEFGVDLGCGKGEAGEMLKKHCGHLVGVDKDDWKLRRAENRGYDELICCDIRSYQVPSRVDIAFLFDVIEHLPKEDGMALLQGLQGPSIILTTPSLYFPIARDAHTCVWSVNELELLGFGCELVSIGTAEMLYGKEILAYRLMGKGWGLE